MGGKYGKTLIKCFQRNPVVSIDNSLGICCWWKCKKKSIKMEINKTTLSVYYSARLFGFAPYCIERNKLNQIIQVKFSRLLCVYSVTLLVVLGCLTNYGLYFDATSTFPIRWATEQTCSWVSVCEYVWLCDEKSILSEFNRFSLITTKWIINWINIEFSP